ncbi:YbhB/YbcL family Raf kinase inhibitor-like protein [Dokdonella sp. MW10]|uniref:YbhB/YbcL family Raf kinase inhibitor-like protein n=1 Tax=Dokdonella sp. MW10 TaxID=2992926 RepID=UPI003F7CF502
MHLHSDSFADGQPIPSTFAFGRRGDAGEPCVLSANRNPHLAWRDAPEGTRSFVVTCIDPDVPTVGDDVNQQGRTVPASLPRTEFVHWLVADIAASVTSIAEGSCADGVVARGRTSPPGPAGSVQGRNDYTGWFAGDADMGGEYRGYDGPCPPWNDELLHHYHFRVYALDIASLGLAEGFDVTALRDAMHGHVLAEAEHVGTYTLNPAVAG